MAEGSSNKDVIYVDVEDEITGIIDKVRSSRHQIVALVVPKRSAVLQSIVNMKLLKRTADGAKKNVVLITSDEGLLPLAGNVGMHVARNLQSKPEIPQAPLAADKQAEVAEESVSMADDDERPLDKSKSVGELAGGAAAAAALDDGDIELDNGEDGPSKQDEDTGDKKKKKEKKPKKNKSLMVPNFTRFRSVLMIGACLLGVLIILAVIAVNVLPKATITIDTNSQTVPSTLQLTLSSDSQSVDTTTGTLPSQVAQEQKTYTGTANATGQQNNGQKATGTVTLSLTDCNPNGETIPAGTGISTNSLTFITQNTVMLSSDFSYGKCKNDTQASATVGVIAQNGGSNYNIQPATFTVPNVSDVSGTSSQVFTGGTDDITQIVSQNDITTAQNKISPNTSAEKSQLQSDLQSQGLFPIPATFTASTPSPTPSVTAGSPASSVTVTESVTYAMYGVKQSDLQTLITSSVNSQISTKSQKILDYGISGATFSVQNQGSGGSESVSMQDNALVGFALDQSTIKNQVAGQKSGTASDTIKAYSGVTNVNVHLSPFFVTSIPKKTSKITVNIVNPKS